MDFSTLPWLQLHERPILGKRPLHVFGQVDAELNGRHLCAGVCS